MTGGAEHLPSAYLKSTAEKYNRYQRRYADEPRESDKALIRVLDERTAARRESGERLTLLDIGCSTGNLLAHISRAVPGFALVGGDLAESAIEQCRADPRLTGMTFEVMDLFDLPAGRFDVVVANAVTYVHGWDDYERALVSVRRALRSGGLFVSFEFAHDFEQDLRVTEVSRSHPDGIQLHLRPAAGVRRVLLGLGFVDVRIEPFRIGIDLERGARYTDDETGFEDLNSYTVQTQSGERLLFRGALHQPWCHVSAVAG